jgi:lipopolysaccharide/colanic/teichoic acid biosynthesis glycosyltransferase
MDGASRLHDRGDGRSDAALALKRAIDLVGAACALALLSPVLGGIAVAILVTQGRPVLFRQLRPGLRGEPFTILKFRTMRPLRPGEIPYEMDHQRITPVGRFLRLTSLDELPELWNVLRGEMSLVGPRPLLLEYLPLYTAEERRRHEVPPGITGWAVVNGRHVLEFRERLRLDVWYVDHWSLGLDLRILARTVVQVLRREDVSVVQDIGRIGFPLRPAGVAGAAAPAPARAGPAAEMQASHTREE